MKRIILLACLTLWGCEEHSPLSAEGPPASYRIGITSLGLAQSPESTDLERLEALASATFKAQDILLGSPTWVEADAAFRAEISSAAPLDRWAFGQVGALIMLDGYVLDGHPTPGKEGAVKYYLPLVTATRNSQVDLVYRALDRFEDTWTNEERRQIASDAAEIGRDAIAKLETGAMPSDGLGPEQRATLVREPTAERSIRRTELEAAVAGLDAIAAP